MRKNNWNKWGEKDEAGAANQVGNQEVIAAAGLVKSGQVIRLTQLLSSKTPVPKHRCGLQLFMNRDGGDYAGGRHRPGGFQFAEDTVIMPLHIGTHVDALCHAWYDDKLYNGFSGNTIRSTSGAAHLGIEKMPPIVTRGVLIDMVHLKGRKLQTSEIIGAKDLQDACALTGIFPKKGDAILIRTGWLESQKGIENVSFDVEPGINEEAAQWLADQEVCIVGADNFAVEVLPFREQSVFPVHQLLIRDHGIALIEGLMLDDLVSTKRFEFLFIASPLPIVGATGGPLSPVVVL